MCMQNTSRTLTCMYSQEEHVTRKNSAIPSATEFGEIVFPSDRPRCRLYFIHSPCFLAVSARTSVLPTVFVDGGSWTEIPSECVSCANLLFNCRGISLANDVVENEGDRMFRFVWNVPTRPRVHVPLGSIMDCPQTDRHPSIHF